MAGDPDIESIGVFYNPRVARAQALAEEIAAWIGQRGLDARICTSADAADVLCAEDLDLLVVLGGDGTILRAARVVASWNAPILGVNLGRVGFLTEAAPETWRDVLSRALVGDYWLEERTMLRAVARRDDRELGQADALNDVVVGRGARAQVVRLRVEIDGGVLADYVADGLIVATPTGSTAYALAAGGPVLPPELRNILLVPVAPHLSMARPVVLSEGAAVYVDVSGERPAVLTVDGEVLAELEDGDRVVVGASPHLALFARVHERAYFYRTLVERLVPRRANDWPR
jgi:NAD+ kinase